MSEPETNTSAASKPPMTAEVRARYGWTAAAAIGALMTYVVSSNGLVFPAFGPAAQVALLAGIVAGVLAPGVPEAAAAAAVGLGLGVAQQPAGALPPVADILVTIAVGAAIAALVRWALASGALRKPLVVTVALVLVAANLWLTAATLAPLAREGGTQDSLFHAMERRPVKFESVDDGTFYRNVVWKMRDGEGFYSAYHDAWFETWYVPPSSVFGVRQPTIFVLWSSLPGWPRSVFWAFLVLATAAVFAAPWVSRRAVPAALGVFGAAAVAAYLLRISTEAGLLSLQEGWTGALAVVVFALFALAQDERRHRKAMAAAAALALLAMMLRELMLFLILAGLVASHFGARQQRRFDLLAWSAALAAGLAYWGVHAVRAGSVFAGRTPDPSAWMGNGAGVLNLLLGLTGSTIILNYHGWVPVALAVVGIVGALAQPDKQYRVFATLAVAMPLVGFLFVSNGALDPQHRIASNYWGAIVVPVLLALGPSAVSLLPSVSARRDDEGRFEAADNDAASDDAIAEAG